jgi:hypothetical protein
MQKRRTQNTEETNQNSIPRKKDSLSRGSFSSSSDGIPSYQYGVLGTCKSSALFTWLAQHDLLLDQDSTPHLTSP